MHLGNGLGLSFNPGVAGLSAGGDTTAPTLSSPVGTQTGSTTATIGATTDEGNGTMYGVVTTSSTAPTATQVKAGQNNVGSAAVFAGSVAVSSTGAKTINATGLTASTAYYAHIMHEDAAGNKSSVVSSAQFTTAAGTTWAASTGWTLTNANLTATASSASPTILVGSVYKTGGTAVVTISANGLGNRVVGLANASESLAAGGFVGQSANSIGYNCSAGQVVYNGSVPSGGGGLATAGAGDIVTWVDNGNGTYTLKKNGTTLFTSATISLGNVTPAASTNNSGLALDLAAGF